MTNTALSARELDTDSEPLAEPVSKKRVARERRPARAKRSRTKTAVERDAQPRSEAALVHAPASPPERAKTQVGTLLVGAGIGAAVTLSVVALGTKRGRGSVFALAVTKSLSYAIARTTERGSLINFVAQAVGSAIA